MSVGATILRWGVGFGIGLGAFFGLRRLMSPQGDAGDGGASSLGDRIVIEANRVIGLTSDNNLEAFEDLVAGAGESKTTALAMAKYYDPKTGAFSSTCGLVVGGIWRRAGIKHPKLAPPYHVSTAISRLQEIGQEHDAYVTDVVNYTPQRGDTMLLDVDKGSAHVNTIVGVKKTATGWVLDTVDGGAGSPGHQGVAARTFTLTRVGNGFRAERPGGPTHNVSSFINVARLAPLAAAA